MYKIYLIEDINGLKYVGSTKQKVSARIATHKHTSKIKTSRCSSRLLDYNNWKWRILEECDKDNFKEREYYWMNKIECVNLKKGDFCMCGDKQQYSRKKNEEYLEKNGMTKSKYFHLWYKSWGGDKRFQNNLLAIDVNLFN